MNSFFIPQYCSCNAISIFALFWLPWPDTILFLLIVFFYLLMSTRRLHCNLFWFMFQNDNKAWYNIWSRLIILLLHILDLVLQKFAVGESSHFFLDISFIAKVCPSLSRWNQLKSNLHLHFSLFLALLFPLMVGHSSLKQFHICCSFR